jgi:hypothetical protein
VITSTDSVPVIIQNGRLSYREDLMTVQKEADVIIIQNNDKGS